MSEQAGREMDARVAEKVMGWTVVRDIRFWDHSQPMPAFVQYAEGKWGVVKVGGSGYEPFDPSESIADAIEVVEKMKADGWAVNIYSGNGSQCWEAEFGHPSDRSQDAGSETSPLPLAICLAALRVKGVEVDNA